MDCSTSGFSVHHQLPDLLKLMFTESMMPSNHLILSSPSPALNLPASQSYPMRRHRNRWPKYWSFSSSISPSNEYSGLISFRIEWFDLLAVQGTLRSPPAPQFENTNSPALCHLYGPTLRSLHDYWKNHSFDYTGLCRQSDVYTF